MKKMCFCRLVDDNSEVVYWKKKKIFFMYRKCDRQKRNKFLVRKIKITLLLLHFKTFIFYVNVLDDVAMFVYKNFPFRIILE